MDEEAAAAKIQAAARGNAVRAQKGKDAEAAPAEAAPEAAPAEAEADAVFEGTEEEVAAAQKIQAMNRGKLARKDMADQQAAATKMQAVQRGKAARKKVGTMTVEEGAEAPADCDLQLKFVILPENYAHEMDAASTETLAAVKARLQQALDVAAAHMLISLGGAELADDGATLAECGVTLAACELQLELQYAEQGAEAVMDGDALLVTVDRDGHAPATVRVTLDMSQLRDKPYLGGYRNKKTTVEYHHACTQTPPDAAMIAAAQAKAAASLAKAQRSTQTATTSTRSVNTMREMSTQMQTPYNPTVVDNSDDRELEARPYFTADQLWALKTEQTLVIQCHVRGWFARRVASALRAELREQALAIEEEAHNRAEEAQDTRRKEIGRRMHPRNASDFETLHMELEAWRLRETKRIHEATLEPEVAQAETELLLSKETQLLQTIDRLHIAAAAENKEIRIHKKLDAMTQPKHWELSDGDTVAVHTPFTTRARELKELYDGLLVAKTSVDERLDVLLHVKWTVTEFDCPLTRDIVQLIDREADMLNRGRSGKSLDGLRKRLANLFLDFIMTPEFNPESQAYQKVPSEFLLRTRTQPITGKA